MIRRLTPLALIVGASAIFTCRPTLDPDLFWHLAQGDAVLGGAFVRTNVFSAAAPSYPQPYVSWGFDALAALASRGGLGGVQALEGALVAAALAALYLAARVRSSALAAGVSLAIALTVVEPRVMPRPYLISWLALAVCAWWWQRVRSGAFGAASAVGIMAALCAVWANLHAEAVFGAGLVVLIGLTAWVSRDAAESSAGRVATAAGLAGLVAAMATPYGAGIFRYLLENALVPQALRIAELQPPAPAGYRGFFAYLVVAAALLGSIPRRIRAWEVAVLALTAAAGLRYIRFTPLVVFAAAPIVADRIDAWIARGWDRRAVWLTAAALVVAAWPASPWRMARAWRVGEAALAPPEVFSRDAVAVIRARHLTGPVFTSLSQGGYIAWAVPGARPLQDSRLQAYPAGHFQRIIDASADPVAWRALVQGVEWAVVSRVWTNELSGAGQFVAPEWERVFQDRAVEVFVRRRP